MALMHKILALSLCLGISATPFAPAQAIPISATDGEDLPQEAPLINLPPGGERFVFPSINGDPQTKHRADQMMRAAIEYKKQDYERAQMRLQSIGISPTAPEMTQDTPPPAVKAYTTQIEQQKAQLAQQEAYLKEQERVQKEQYQQQLQQYLFNAIQKGYVPWVEHALKNGARLDVPFGGYVPVQYAVASRQLDVARYLIEQGAAFGNRENAYYTLFHQAAYAGHMPLINILMLRKADPLVEDSSGKQAWEYAKTPQIREFLMTSGTRQDVLPGAPGSAASATDNPDPFADPIFPQEAPAPLPDAPIAAGQPAPQQGNTAPGIAGSGAAASAQ